MAIYPNLPADLEVRLKAVEMAAKGVANYLDTAECPYGEGLRAYLRKMLNAGSGPGAARVAEIARDDAIFDVPEGDKYDVLLREIEATIQEMNAIQRQVGGGGYDDEGGGDAGDRIQLVKAKTSLLEKWASLKERVLTLKEMSQFQSAVISVLDEVLDVDQRAQFRDRLRNFKSVSGMLNQTAGVTGADRD